MQMLHVTDYWLISGLVVQEPHYVETGYAVSSVEFAMKQLACMLTILVTIREDVDTF